ncbi:MULTISPECIES: vWA domain-containing protein [Vibrio]|uniref:VWFA domain-containing protein n=1 Tax=Vibrio jasicida TaxID=766224 RepID=A0AAU9QSX1_9VIBR|nr:MULTISPECIES: VWA domain-containing protein [Vibrio]MCZ2799056.1 VWA domain-containing protein [Vibrio alginolyticus]PAW02473.1 hypothetical protein CKJ79_17565 [Vibrio coralliilyticus]CAH1588162.1 VWFA domain-containing protein [Vibrio jasicida]CAH1599909.1 VWFA domain-containing protein [Vibrio jasicida]
MGNKKIVGISLIALAVMTGCSEQKKASNELDSDTTQQVEVTDLKAETLIAVSPKAVKTEALSTKELNAVQYQSRSDSLVSSSKVKRQQPMVLAENIALGGIDGALAPMPMMDENYQKTPSNGVIQTVTEPLSTFSIDVDTGSYANVRNQLNNGYKPVSDAIREEAFINYFDYDYPVPEDRGQPFSVNTEIAASPWNKDRQLLRIALKGYEIPADARKPSNLVFLIDTSGSMHSQNKLPLLKRSLVMLTKELNENDAVSLVTYAGSSKVVLEPTKGSDKQTIINAINQLTSGGGTAGESGIRLAYQQARAGFINDGVNRIMLATDGDFNIGISSIDKLKEIVASERKQGVSLTTLGFGRGNYNDALMEQLADIGDGNYAYIDSIRESRKVFHHQMSGTLQTIASDVKAQIEFNPNVVKEYRLIGYQNRLLDKADFNNDAIDAGEIGAGHTVTAMYELTLVGHKGQVDDLRYQSQPERKVSTDLNDEVALVKLRYKLPGETTSNLITSIVKTEDIQPDFAKASSEFQFATSVAAFAQKLKGSSYLNGMNYDQISEIARKNKGTDEYNYRGEFVELIRTAENIQ